MNGVDYFIPRGILESDDSDLENSGNDTMDSLTEKFESISFLPKDVQNVYNSSNDSMAEKPAYLDTNSILFSHEYENAFGNSYFDWNFIPIPAEEAGMEDFQTNGKTVEFVDDEINYYQPIEKGYPADISQSKLFTYYSATSNDLQSSKDFQSYLMDCAASNDLQSSKDFQSYLMMDCATPNDLQSPNDFQSYLMMDCPIGMFAAEPCNETIPISLSQDYGGGPMDAAANKITESVPSYETRQQIPSKDYRGREPIIQPKASFENLPLTSNRQNHRQAYEPSYGHGPIISSTKTYGKGPMHSDESYRSTAIPQTSFSRQKQFNERRRQKKVQNYCVFCFQNGERAVVFNSHVAKDANGNTVCPRLQNYTCPNCGANGAKAHTKRYCPQKRIIYPEDLEHLNMQKPSQLRF